MRVFKSDIAGNEDQDGDFLGVELEGVAEARQLRKKGDLPEGRNLVLVFDRDGALKQFPGYGQFRMNADESAYFESLRKSALAAKL